MGTAPLTTELPADARRLLQAHVAQIENAYHSTGSQLFEVMQRSIDGAGQDIMGLAQNDPKKIDVLVSKMFDLTPKVEDEGDDQADRLKEFMLNLKANNFKFPMDGHNLMSQRWKRHIKGNAAEAKKYGLCEDNSERSEFRATFAKKEFDEWSEKHSYTETLEESSFNRGQYLPIQRIAHKEGGGAAGMEAALNHALKAMQVGGKYVLYDSWTKRVKFLYYVRGYEDRFTKAWAKHQEWKQKKVADSAGAAGGGAGTGPATGDKDAERPGGKRQAKKLTEKEKEERKELAAAVNSAKKLKQIHSEAVSDSRNLINLIESNVDWKKWDTPFFKGQLVAL
eukprot:6083554-Pyramimonas_sp.AAC.1